MKELLSKLIDYGVAIGGKLLLAIVVLIVGHFIIKGVKKAMAKADKISKLDKTVQSFLKNLVTILLYVILLITVIGILGIPMTSVVTVLASCGLAVGLALQGALSNFAGGIMILIFKPFRVGDYIEASGAEGTVRDISVFYTTLITIDNKRITVPNGDLMNANVTNFSAEPTRRIDLPFKLTNDCDPDLAHRVLLQAAENTDKVLAEPAPFARMTAVDDDTYIFTVRAWVNNEDYWDVYYTLLENCSDALAQNGIDDPEERIAVRLVKDE
ncbi:MAG: mechanosensitive ion channel family protein [Oscillospiraceae bacterium]|nr:mechanosensitive ion channel family protein [Oscillospiraceae bacterium]